MIVFSSNNTYITNNHFSSPLSKNFQEMKHKSYNYKYITNFKVFEEMIAN